MINKGNKFMTKKEKIIAIYMTLSMFLLISSSIYTIVKNKPEGYSFRIEIWYQKLIKSIMLNNEIK